MNTLLIKKPWITEKSTNLNAQGKYVFMVVPHATKQEIKKAIKDIYKVDVVMVNVLNRIGKQKRFRGVMTKPQDAYRKAVVTLKEGQKIDLQ
jgi:large subunit ribosomal protein L23